MVRLNGTNQYLTGAFPDRTWNAMFLRVSFNPSFFDGTYRYILDMTDTGMGLIRLYTYQGPANLVFYPYFYTSNTHLAPSRGTYANPSPHTAGEGPTSLVMVWDGSAYAFYTGGGRRYKYACTGTFRWGVNNFRVGTGFNASGGFFQGDIGHIILHDEVPEPFVGLPDYVPDCELGATAYLEALGIPTPLVLYDWRANDGTNYGSGGSAYNLTPQNSPTFMASDFQYKWVEETIPLIEYPRATVFAARLRATRLRARVRL